MTKLCPRGKSAAKRKFKVYPSAYANAYASKICAGKIKDPSGVKRKDFKGRKPAAMGGRIGYKDGSPKTVPGKKLKIVRGFTTGRGGFTEPRVVGLKQLYDYASGPQTGKGTKDYGPSPAKSKFQKESKKGKVKHAKRPRYKASGGLIEATQKLKRQGFGMGGSCIQIKGFGKARRPSE